MDIHRLEVFCKVLELRSFTKAADAVFLTQPTVSEHIRALEELVGERLIDRLGRDILPTPAGKILYQYARDLIRLRDEALQAIDRYRGTLSGQLLIGASTIPGTYILPALVGAFKSMYPDIQLTLKISDSADVAERIMEGSIEAGLIGARWEERKLILEEVFSDELVLVVHPEHPWAGRDLIDVGEIVGEPFILRERGSGTRKVMIQALEAGGISASQLRVVAEMGSTEAQRQGVKAQIGIAILSLRAVAEDLEHGTLKRVHIKDFSIQRPFYLVQRKNRKISPVCSAFVNYLREEGKKSKESGKGDEFGGA